jgi:RNA polymerase sigma-70 factor (ECF subfamily)
MQNDLLRRFAEGDIDAFEKLFRQFEKQVYSWIVRIVRDTGVAEDLTVETFWRIYMSRIRFDPEADFAPWARRIATNLAIDHLKHRRLERELSDEIMQETSPNPALQHETREQIRRAFRSLPAYLQVTATLALIEERPYKEIAESLGKSESAIRVRIFRAVRALRKELRRTGAR